MKSIKRTGAEIMTLMRMFEIFLKHPPTLDAEKHVADYIASDGGGWMNEALIEVSIFKRMCSIEIPLRFRYAFIAQLFSVLESRAIELCDLLKEEGQMNLAIDDLKGGRSISGVRVFFKKHYPLKAFRWEVIEYLENCRNMIVHADGYDTGVVGKGKIKTMLNACPFLVVSSTGRLFVSHYGCEYFLNGFGEFFDAIFQKHGHVLDSCSFSVGEPDEFRAFENKITSP